MSEELDELSGRGRATTLATWFQEAVNAVKVHVNRHGGAVLINRSDLKAACLEIDPTLSSCPHQVWDHITCALWRRGGLESTGGLHDEMLVIYAPAAISKAQALANSPALRQLEPAS